VSVFGNFQGGDLSGNVREFDSCQEMSALEFLVKVWEKLPKTVSCIFASIQVFSRSLFCIKYGFGSCTVVFLPTPLTTCIGMI